MQLVIVTVLACVAATSAQALGGLGVIGSEVGGKVGADVGLLTGTVLDTVPNVIGIGRNRGLTPPRPLPGVRAPGPRGPDRGYGSVGGRSYERQGSGGEYAKGADYIRERTVREREQGGGYDSGRGWQLGERGRGGDRRGRGGDRREYYRK